MDAEMIAKGLSLGSARAIIGMTPNFAKPRRGDAQFAGMLSDSLVKWRQVGAGGRKYALTPLGLAVRDVLLKEQG